MNTQRRHVTITALTLMFCLLFLLPMPASAARSDIARQHDQTAFGPLQAEVEQMQPGWNLGNSLDTIGPDETYWGNPRVTRELIKQIADQGFHSIRIPVTWDGHVGDGPEFGIDPDYLARVEQIVNWALDENLYVILNVHHDSYLWISQMDNDHDEVLARYRAIWSQIAGKFSSSSTKLLFESVNEPRFNNGKTDASDIGAGSNVPEDRQLQLLDEINANFVEVVRSSGGLNDKRPLVLPTLEGSPTQVRLDSLYQTIARLKDPYFIATVHYYGYWPFSVNIAGHTTLDTDTKNDAARAFRNMYRTLVAHGIPVILGEYGLLGFDKDTTVIEQGEKLKYFEFIGNQIKEHKITAMLWDNGQHWNRKTSSWSDPKLFQMIRASWSGRSAVGDRDLIFVEQGKNVQDARLEIKLSGNKLASLFAGEQQLIAGTDYAIEGSTLTIYADTLSRLVSQGSSGQKAVLTATFDQGSDWHWKVMLTSTPVLHPASGTTAAFSIPTSFAGDLLATMEAVYASGENTPMQDWTPYKEFGSVFRPSYETNTITLQPEWLAQLRDGQTELTFHFWSGKTIQYTLYKKGTQLNGATHR